MKLSLGCIVAFGLVLTTVRAFAADYYVSPNGNDSNPGTLQKPWKTLSQANNTLQPGDTVYLRGGKYDGQSIVPNRSGSSESKRITYQAYPGEKPVLRRVKIGISLQNKNYITIDGIDMDGEIIRDKIVNWPGVGGGSSNINHWVKMENSDYNVIKNVHFQKAHGWTGFGIGDSKFNKILDSTFDFVGGYDDGTGDDPGDVLSISSGSDHNLIQGNTFKHGGHNLLNINARYNVVRSNVFNNDWSDVLGGNKGNRNASFKNKKPINGRNYGYNLFEDNIVMNAGVAIDDPGPAAMKVLGEGQIVRRNIFLDNYRVGIVSSNGKAAGNIAHKNRIYHNVFYNNGGAAWDLAGCNCDGKTLDDNIFKNNIVYMGRHNPEKAKLEVDVAFVQQSTLSDNKILSNLFFNGSQNDGMIYSQSDDQLSVSDYQKRYPNNVSKNVQKDPQLVSTALSDKSAFQITASSPAKDAGAFLTQTRSSGSGVTIPVQDPHYFTDGFGVINGDEIKVGNNATVRVVAVDYNNRDITVDRTISWSSGDQVSLNYSGQAPDIGAFESGLSGDGSSIPANGVAPPSPPQML